MIKLVPPGLIESSWSDLQLTKTPHRLLPWVSYIFCENMGALWQYFEFIVLQQVINCNQLS